MFRRRPTQIQLEPDEVRNHIDHFNRQVEKQREERLKEQKAMKAAKAQLQNEADDSMLHNNNRGGGGGGGPKEPMSPDPMHDVTLDHDAAMERILMRHERMGIVGVGRGGSGGGGGGGGASGSGSGSGGGGTGAGRSLLETPPRPAR